MYDDQVSGGPGELAVQSGAGDPDDSRAPVMKLRRRTTTTVDIVLNPGPDAQADVDVYPGGLPYLMITDGAAEILIKPPDDTVTEAVVAFADELATAAQKYAVILRESSL